MPTLELTTTIRRVSSSPKARSGLSPAAAAGRAVASIRYITRSTAAEAVEWSGARLDAAAPEGHKAVKAALADAIHERAQEGGKQGRVVAGRFIVSLPIGWPLEARQEALRQVCTYLAPAGSDALAMGALHNDKPDNPHMHILAVDGLEAPELARARADARRANMPPGSPPKAVLARRRDALRLNDLKRPKELRRDIAEILNTIAQREGLDGVEWRSFADRGITRPATTHDGPEKRARQRRQAEERPPIDYTPPQPRPVIQRPLPRLRYVRRHPHPFPSPLWPLPQTSGPHPSQASPASATERAGPTASGKPPPGCWHRRPPRPRPRSPKRSSKTGAGLLSPASQTETKNVKAFFFSSMKSTTYPIEKRQRGRFFPKPSSQPLRQRFNPRLRLSGWLRAGPSALFMR